MALSSETPALGGQSLAGENTVGTRHEAQSLFFPPTFHPFRAELWITSRHDAGGTTPSGSFPIRHSFHLFHIGVFLYPRIDRNTFRVLRQVASVCSKLPPGLPHFLSPSPMMPPEHRNPGVSNMGQCIQPVLVFPGSDDVW